MSQTLISLSCIWRSQLACVLVRQKRSSCSSFSACVLSLPCLCSSPPLSVFFIHPFFAFHFFDSFHWHIILSFFHLLWWRFSSPCLCSSHPRCMWRGPSWTLCWPFPDTLATCRMASCCSSSCVTTFCSTLPSGSMPLPRYHKYTRRHRCKFSYIWLHL